MTLVECMINLCINSTAHVQVLLCINLIFLVSACTLSVVLIYKLLSDNREELVADKHKKRFHCLLIVTVLTLTITLVPTILGNVVISHSHTPLKRINYDDLCKNINIDNLRKIFYYVATTLGTTGYNLTIFVYYYRLNSIFDNTMYSVSNKTTYCVYLSILVGFSCCLFSVIGIIVNSINVWNLSILILFLQYFSVSLYLCFILKSKLILLIKQFNKIQLQNNKRKNSIDHDIQMTSTLFDVMKRFTILTYFSSIFTIIIILFLALSTIANTHTNYTFFQDITATIACIDFNVTIICFINQFPFANCIYNKTCQKFEKMAMCGQIMRAV